MTVHRCELKPGIKPNLNGQKNLSWVELRWQATVVGLKNDSNSF